MYDAYVMYLLAGIDQKESRTRSWKFSSRVSHVPVLKRGLIDSGKSTSVDMTW